MRLPVARPTHQPEFRQGSPPPTPPHPHLSSGSKACLIWPQFTCLLQGHLVVLPEAGWGACRASLS